MLTDLVKSVQPNADLLRIYWYDGTSRGPTQDHRLLADFDNLKLRLGFINSVGQQKGVDSLLVTDLVELARNGAICDAMLLGGDEDLRIGVQIAQSFGVRVHLVGIEPSRGSQSLQLRNEVDTKHEITKENIAGVLEVLNPPTLFPSVVLPTVQKAATGYALKESEIVDDINDGIQAILTRFSETEIGQFRDLIQSSTSVPAALDRRVLGSCRTALGRDLTPSERSSMRKRLIECIKAVKPSE